MQNPAFFHQRKGTNCNVKNSSTIVSKKHNTIDESKIKPFAANRIVRPFSSRNKVEHNDSKAITVNHNADTNTLPPVMSNQDVDGYKKIDTDQILLYSFGSSNLRNCPLINKIQNLITESNKEYTDDTCKLTTEKEKHVAKHPNKPDYKSIGIKPIFHKEYADDTCKLTTEKEKHIAKNTNKPDYNSIGMKPIFHKEYTDDTCELRTEKEKHVARNRNKPDYNSIGMKPTFHTEYTDDTCELRTEKEKHVARNRNKPDYNSIGMKPTFHTEYTDDTCKLTTEKEKHIAKTPNKPEYNSIGIKSIYHGIQKPILPVAAKAPKVDPIFNNTSKYAEPETRSIVKEKSFRYCTSDCKGAHKKIVTEKKKKEKDTFGITHMERNILMRSCANRIKEGDYDTALAISEIIAAYPTTVEFGLSKEEVNLGASIKSKNKQRTVFRRTKPSFD